MSNQRRGLPQLEQTPSAQRSRTMRAVRSIHTSPEMIVRRILHAAGYRYRLHAVDLPGKPDIVFRRRRQAIFVHGCFWHGHDCPRGARLPRTNRAYWAAKIARNRERDDRAMSLLIEQGWSIEIVWECQTKDTDALKARLESFLAIPK